MITQFAYSVGCKSEGEGQQILACQRKRLINTSFYENRAVLAQLVQCRGDQLDQFRESHFRRQRSARAMKVSDMNYSIWTICDNN